MLMAQMASAGFVTHLVWCGRWTEVEVRGKAAGDFSKANGYTLATSVLAVIRLENSLDAFRSQEVERAGHIPGR